MLPASCECRLPAGSVVRRLLVVGEELLAEGFLPLSVWNRVVSLAEDEELDVAGL